MNAVLNVESDMKAASLAIPQFFHFQASPGFKSSPGYSVYNANKEAYNIIGYIDITTSRSIYFVSATETEWSKQRY